MNTTKDSYSVIIVGGNFYNKGAQLMIDTILSLLESQNLECNPVIIDSFPSENTRSKYSKATVLPLPFYLNLIYSLYCRLNFSLNTLARCIYHASRRALTGQLFKDIRSSQQAIGAFKTASLVVDISGYGFHTSGTHADSMNYIQIAFANIARGFTVPYVYMPQSYGPFVDNQSHLYKDLHFQIINSLKAASRVYAREKRSIEELKEVTRCSHVIYWPDIALLYAPSYRKNLPEEVTKSSLKESVLVIPNARLYDKYLRNSVDNLYNNLIRQTLAKELNTVVLVHSSDDAIIAQQLKCKFGSKITVLSGNYAPSTLESIIQSAGFVVSARYHGLVVSLRNSVPCLAIAWSHKYDELMDLYGLGRFLYRMPDTLEPDIHLEKLTLALESKEEIKEAIDEKNEALRAKYPSSELLSFLN